MHLFDFDRPVAIQIYGHNIESMVRAAQVAEESNPDFIVITSYSIHYTKLYDLNIAGGLKINDPATDLAVICSILSSNIDIAINHKICFAGEVGLTGEIRAVRNNFV